MENALRRFVIWKFAFCKFVCKKFWCNLKWKNNLFFSWDFTVLPLKRQRIKVTSSFWGWIEHYIVDHCVRRLFQALSQSQLPFVVFNKLQYLRLHGKKFSQIYVWCDGVYTNWMAPLLHWSTRGCSSWFIICDDDGCWLYQREGKR